MKSIRILLKMSEKVNIRPFIYLLLAVLFLVQLCLPRVVFGRESEGNKKEVIHFFGQEDPSPLVNPGQLYKGPAGRIAVYDKHLHKFEFFPSREKKSFSWNDFIDREAKTTLFERWGLSNEVQGVWADTETFWCYDTKIANNSDTVFMYNLFDPADTMVLTGPIEDIKFTSDAWFIQRPGGKFEKRQPIYQGGIIDTALLKSGGSFAGQLGDSSYVFREGKQVLLYREEGDTGQKSFSGLKAVQTADKYIYVLLADGKILKLNQDFQEEFSFEIIGNFNFRDFLFTDGHAYFTGEQGLYKTNLDESERSLFYATATVHPEEVSKSAVNLFNKNKERVHRIWGDSEEIYLWNNGHSQVVSVDEQGLLEAKKVEDESQIPLLAFQYFQSPHTTWDGRTLYYYFPGEKLVESYDDKGAIKRKTFLADPPDYLKEVQFAGAGKNYILMGGKLIKSSGKKVKAFAVYNWSGNLQRIFQLEHPLENNLSPQPEGYPHYEYSGGNLVYAFYSDHIQTYDLYGYPGQKIGDLVYPEDIALHGDKLYILDGRGYRLRQQTRLKSRNIRFATSSALGNIKEGYWTADDEIILSASSGDKNFLTRYNPRESTTNKFLEHPRKSLRYPVVSARGDTIFFWGKEAGKEKYQLYRFDSKRYVAEELDYFENLRGRAHFDDYKNILLVPRKSDENDTNLFAYYDVSAGISGVIKNSEKLDLLIADGPQGYTGVVKNEDSYEIVSGFLANNTETGAISFKKSKTHFTVDAPVRQLKFTDDKFFLALEKNKRQTNLIIYPVNGTNPVDKPEVINYFTGAGKLRWLSYSENKKLLLWRGDNKGRLVNAYETSPEPGGVDGEVLLPPPGVAEGVELLTSPGGQLITTSSGGNFTIDGVQTGYLEIFPPSYKYHFEQSLEVLVNPAEYTVNQSIKLHPLEELGLLERGLENFEKSKLSRARIALEAFRSLVGSGPYYSWTTRPLLEIYREEKNVSDLEQIYKNSPEDFGVGEKYFLWTNSENEKNSLLKDFLPLLSGLEREIVRYRLWRNRFFEKETKTGKFYRYPLFLEQYIKK